MTEEKARQTRGGVVKGYAKYIKKKWGTDGVLACQRDIGELGFEVKEDAWYPEEVNVKILQWIADNYGLEYVEKAAASTISERGVVAYAAKLAGIKKVLERGVEDYYRNFNYGKIDIDISDNQAMVTLTDSTSNEVDCVSWKGALKGVYKLVNKTGDVQEIECCHKGKGACKFLMTWE